MLQHAHLIAGLSWDPAIRGILVVMVGVAVVPFTVGGWGLRELAMVSLFGNYGLTPERALVFSMYFGLANILAGNAPIAMRGMKRAINEFARGELDEEVAARRHRESMRGDEIKEGIKAFAEKRSPRF